MVSGNLATTLPEIGIPPQSWNRRIPKFHPLICLLAATVTLASSRCLAQESYPVHPDWQPKEGVPQGKVMSYRYTDSKIDPGTEREYFIDVPAQYDGSKPARFTSQLCFSAMGRSTDVPLVSLVWKSRLPAPC